MKYSLVLALCLLLTACDSALTFLAGEGWQADGMAMKQTSWQGSHADATAPTLITARNEAEWQNLWQRVGQPAPGPLPDKRMAVAVLLGQKLNTAASVDIINADMESNLGRAEQLLVRYIVREPTVTPATRGLSSPWAIRLTLYSEVSPDFVEIKAKAKE